MTARNVLLALLIIVVGTAITASRQGVFAHWRGAIAAWLGDIEEIEPLVEAWSFPAGDWQEVHRFSGYKAGTIETFKSLIIENPNGRVTVTGGSQGGVGYEAIQYRRGKTTSGSPVLKPRAGVGVDLWGSGNSLHLRVRGPKKFWRDTRVDLTITAPADLDITVGSASGPVQVKDMTGRVNVTTASGDISVTGASRAEVKTASGSIQLRDIRGPVDAYSVSGSIAVQNVSGEMQLKTISGSIRGDSLDGALSARTISGDITLDQYSGSPATLNTTSGRIDASLAKRGTNEFSAHSISGSIWLAVPIDSDCTVRLKSVSGYIDTPFPLINLLLPAPQRPRLARGAGYIRGTLGRGTGSLEAETVSGSITLIPEPKAIEHDGRPAARRGVIEKTIRPGPPRPIQRPIQHKHPRRP